MTETRYLALDFGLKRIGLALSDPLKIFSYPYAVIPYDNNFIHKLEIEVSEKKVSKIILGYPVTLRGEKTPISDEIMKLKNEIENTLNVEVILWDERFTSEIAKNNIIESVSKKSKRREKGLLDQNAAAVILQEFLNSSGKAGNKY